MLAYIKHNSKTNKLKDMYLIILFVCVSMVDITFVFLVVASKAYIAAVDFQEYNAMTNVNLLAIQILQTTERIYIFSNRRDEQLGTFVLKGEWICSPFVTKSGPTGAERRALSQLDRYLLFSGISLNAKFSV